MIMLPHLLQGFAIPAIADLLSKKPATGQDASNAQGSFSSILKSELDSRSGAVAQTGAGTAVADPAKTASADFSKALSAVADTAKEKLTSSAASTMTPGIMLLPVNAVNTAHKPSASQALNVTNTLNQAAAATGSSSQIKIAGDNPSLVMITPQQNQAANNAGWDRYKMDAVASNTRGGSSLLSKGVFLGLKIPIG